MWARYTYSAALASLRAIARVLAESFEHAAQGLAITVRALFQRSVAASSADAESAAHTPELLSDLPQELMPLILSRLSTRDLACLATTCRSFWCGVPNPPLPRPSHVPGHVETELRRRAEARGLRIGSSLPEGVLPWVPYLLKRELHDAQRREAPLAGGFKHSIFLDREGRLHLACHRVAVSAGTVGEPLLEHDWGSDADECLTSMLMGMMVPSVQEKKRIVSVATSNHHSTISVPATLVPSLQEKRIVSVATSDHHCLALSAEGEVYSWGDGSCGVLGHADGNARVGPRKIETLESVESIAAGRALTSAAVDDRGRLFTWGRGALRESPTGLGYELDPETECQLTPKRVDALSEDRVVGVALGCSFTLAVTDAGAVFSFGRYSQDCTLGHSSLESEVLPRRIEALAQTGRRFVAVAAGDDHALALTEEGEVYGWGGRRANGYGQDLSTPQRVTALTGERFRLVSAHANSSCAVTEKGELYAWGHGYSNSFSLGHGICSPQLTPKRVEALRHVKVATAAAGLLHTLVAGEDGEVWAFGGRLGLGDLGLGDADAPAGFYVKLPTPISNLRVRTVV